VHPLTVAGAIGDPATAQRVISEGVAKFGRIDTLVITPAFILASFSRRTPGKTNPTGCFAEMELLRRSMIERGE
jgi:hypothetical protein